MAGRNYTGWTTRSIRKLQSNPPPKPKRKFEGGDIPGFHVQITPAGTCTPALQYTWEGKRSFFPVGHRLKAGEDDKTIGKWLKEARRAAEDAHELVVDGVDPKAEQARQNAPKAGTLGQLLDIYLEGLEGRYSYDRTVQDMDRDVRPYLGGRPANEIGPGDIAETLARVYDRAAEKGKGGDAMARRIRVPLRRAFEIALTFDNDPKMRSKYPGLRFDVNFNPVDKTPRPEQGKARTRNLNPEEIKKVWDACRTYEDKRVGLAVKLMLLTGYRRATAAGLRWDEVRDDVIVIPADAVGRNKSNLDHYLPITPMIREVLDEARAFNSEAWVFPAVCFGKGPGHMNPSRMNDGVKAIVKSAKVEKFTPHDLRRTVVTQMKTAGVDGETRRRIVSHEIKEDVHDKVYDQTDWEFHRSAVTDGLMQWHQRLQRIVNPKAPTPIRRAS